MGIAESVKAVMWARKRQPPDVAKTGREPGEIILQGIAAADVSDPARVGELGEENVSDRTYKMMAMNVSGADPLGAVRLYGDHVLPELRD
jgi:hypothetical protein